MTLADLKAGTILQVRPRVGGPGRPARRRLTDVRSPPPPAFACLVGAVTDAHCVGERPGCGGALVGPRARLCARAVPVGREAARPYQALQGKRCLASHGMLHVAVRVSPVLHPNGDTRWVMRAVARRRPGYPRRSCPPPRASDRQKVLAQVDAAQAFVVWCVWEHVPSRRRPRPPFPLPAGAPSPLAGQSERGRAESDTNTMRSARVSRGRWWRTRCRRCGARGRDHGCDCGRGRLRLRRALLQRAQRAGPGARDRVRPVHGNEPAGVGRVAVDLTASCCAGPRGVGTCRGAQEVRVGRGGQPLFPRPDGQGPHPQRRPGTRAHDCILPRTWLKRRRCARRRRSAR